MIANIKKPLDTFFVYKTYLGRHVYYVAVVAFVISTFEGFGVLSLLPLLEALDAGDSQSVVIDFYVFEYAFQLFHLILLVALVFILKGLVSFSASWYIASLSAKLERDIRVEILNGISEADYDYVRSTKTGHFLNLITTQVDQFVGSFIKSSRLASLAFSLAVYAAVLGYVSKEIFVFLFFAIPTILVGFIFLNRWVRSISIQYAAANSVLLRELNQYLLGLKYLKSTGLSGIFGSRTITGIETCRSLRRNAGVAEGISLATREPIAVVAFSSIIGFYMYWDGSARLAELAVVLVVFYRAFSALLQFQQTLLAFFSQAGGLEQVRRQMALLAEYREISGIEGEKPSWADQPLDIRFSKVSFSYGESKIIDHLSLEIPANTSFGIVGPSGVGKSTLIDLAIGLLKPESGAVFVGGENLQDVDVNAYRRKIGLVSQDSMIFDDSIFNNIALGIESYRSDDPQVFSRVVEAAKLACIHDYIVDLPDGYWTQLGERGVRMSGGQRQRVCLARELLKKPAILFLDEPTSALDIDTENAIKLSIDALRGMCTIIIVTHRESLIKGVDSRLRFMEGGSYVLDKLSKKLGEEV